MANRIFLSASIPPSDLTALRNRPDAWQDLYLGYPTQPREVERAIQEMIPHILKHRDFTLVFGGHPAITPIVADLARRRNQSGKKFAIEIYQSAFFAGQEPFNQRQDQHLYQHIQWTPICQPPVTDPQPVTSAFAPGAHPLQTHSQAGQEHQQARQALGQLEEAEKLQWREASLLYMRRQMISDCQAGIFLGGMKGISDELKLFEQANPQSPVWLITRPGGRTARIVAEREAPSHWRIESEYAYETIGENIYNEIQQLTETSD